MRLLVLELTPINLCFDEIFPNLEIFVDRGKCVDKYLCFLWAVGLQYDVINKKLGSSAEREGLHNGPPGFEFIVFPSVFRSLEFSLKVGYSENVMILFDLRKKSYDASIKKIDLCFSA